MRGFEQFKLQQNNVKLLHLVIILTFGPRHEKTCLWRFTNNTGADQPAHNYVQTDQRLCCSLFGKERMCTCNRWNFDFVASLCSWKDWFLSRFFGDPEDRFSRDEAQMYLVLQLWYILTSFVTVCMSHDLYICIHIGWYHSPGYQLLTLSA